MPSLRVLFVVEALTDIRFVVGLSEICDVTMVVPARHYEESGLCARVAASGAVVQAATIKGGPLALQWRSLSYLWRVAGNYDVIVTQERLRRSFNARIVGRIRRVPVVAIRADVDYCGVDTDLFCPAEPDEREKIRQRLTLPADKFLIVLVSGISPENDFETVVEAVSLARARGLEAVLLILGGEYQSAINVAVNLGVPDATAWVYGRPSENPMQHLPDYFRAADVVVQGSLEDRHDLSPLEALACATPVIATAVDSLAADLGEYASLTPCRDAEAMARALLVVAAIPHAARRQAQRGREYVCREWSREKAFCGLHRRLIDVVHDAAGHAAEDGAAA